MNAAVFAYSRQGCETGLKVGSCLCQAPVYYAPARHASPPYQPVQPEDYEACFSQCDALIFVGACGIALRKIAPFVSKKTSDPAVLCLDERGQFVISLLSGHIGGANRLTRFLAQQLGATPVITTATDVNGKFSVDTWATEQGCAISSMSLAKAVSAGILERNIPICSDYPLPEALPAGLIAGDTGELGIFIGCHTRSPFVQTLRLIPKVLTLGIGCRKGIEKEAVLSAVRQVLEENQLDLQAVSGAASIDLKSGETGLLEACRELEIPIAFYSSDTLARIPGNFTPSAFVKSVTGVDNVCERAAVTGGGNLIVNKTAVNGVTVAVAARNWEVHFG